MGDQPLVTAPVRQMLVDSVYEALKELVMDQRIPPGGRINIDRLARELKVSPTPVRESLARLESEGLVTKQPHRGYSTTPLLDAASFDQLYALRLLLEPYAAAKAATQPGREHVRGLEQVTEAMRRALRDATTGQTYKEFRAFAAWDARFHETIAVASKNMFVRDAIVRLRAHLHLYRLYAHVGTVAETLTEHARILDAIRRQNPAQAAAAMRRHIARSQARQRRGLARLHKRGVSDTAGGGPERAAASGADRSNTRTATAKAGLPVHAGR
jgi:DNA-binding GntR family transcriptional regulator